MFKKSITKSQNKKLNLSLSLVYLFSFSLSGCGKKSEVADLADSLNESEAAVESGVSMISGMADDQAGSELSWKPHSSNPTLASSLSVWSLFAATRANADSCYRASLSSCLAGLKSAEYNQCSVLGTLRSMNGSVQLTYSNSGCTMLQAGDSVSRTYNVAISGSRGGVVSLTSAEKADYRGTSYGGGGSIQKTLTGFQLNILGRHSSFQRNGKTLSDVSVRTLQPVEVTGSLNRDNRVINGGQLEVNHNLKGFTSLLVANNVQWNSQCCHPIAGEMSITYSGSKTGTATVTFNGCGTATLNQDGQQQSIALSYCE